MLSKLDIVKGGVAKKDLTPILKHLRIAGGWITSTNGRLTVSTPLPEMAGLEITVPADKFITAIKACKEPSFKITDTGRLSITGKKFRALLPMMNEIEFPSPKITGEQVVSSNLLEAIKKLNQFVGDDASRSWACGILLYKNMAYATNNTIFAQCPVEWDGPAINIPDFLIDELLRLKKDIVQIKTSGTNVTFELADSIWLNSTLLSVAWPNVNALFGKIDFSNLKPVSKDLQQAIQDIIPFCPDKKFLRVAFTETAVTTDEGVHEAQVEMEGLHPSVWRAEPLLNLLDKIKSQGLLADFSQWPKPCPWRREDGVEGLIIGLRQ